MSLITEKATTMPSDDNPVISQLDLGEPPQDYLDYAKRELGEDPETRCQVLADFRDLIYERGECIPHRTDDAFLLKFLRAKKFSIRHAHKMLVNYCEFKEDNPEYFDNVSITDLKRVGKSNIIAVPPYKDQAGHRILLYRFGLWNPEEFSIVEMIQATMLILELAIVEQKAQIMGGVCLFDLSGLTMQQIWYMTPKLAKQMFQIMVTSFPLRVEAVHIINQPWIFESVFNLFKPFMNEQMRKRLFIHGNNMESLHEHMEPKYLPERYGGVHPDYNYNDWIHWFLTTEKICTEMRSLGYLTDEKEKKRKSDI